MAAEPTPSPPTVFLGALVVQFVLHVVVPGPRLLSAAAAVGAGLVVTAAGVLLHVRAWRHFRRRGAPVDTLAAPPALVTDGPFAWGRNPMYLAGVTILAGTALLHGTASPWLVPAAFGVVVSRAFIRPEERLLAARFGADYAAYRGRVGRWIGTR